LNKLPSTPSGVLSSQLGDDLRQLDKMLSTLNGRYFYDIFIVGLGTTAIMTILLISQVISSCRGRTVTRPPSSAGRAVSHFNPDSGPVRDVSRRYSVLWGIITLLVGLPCIVSFLVPMILIIIVYVKARNFTFIGDVKCGRLGYEAGAAAISAIGITLVLLLTKSNEAAGEDDRRTTRSANF
jgi:hypothetical protein